MTVPNWLTSFRSRLDHIRKKRKSKDKKKKSVYSSWGSSIQIVFLTGSCSIPKNDTQEAHVEKSESRSTTKDDTQEAQIGYLESRKPKKIPQLPSLQFARREVSQWSWKYDDDGCVMWDKEDDS